MCASYIYLTAEGSPPSDENCSIMPPRTSNETTGLKIPIWLGLKVNNTSTDCPGLMWSCDGEKWKCAVEWRESVSGKLADSLFTVQRASICSPTVQSPNLNTGLGDIDSSTGKAVPTTATSTLEPRKDQTIHIRNSQTNSWYLACSFNYNFENVLHCTIQLLFNEYLFSLKWLQVSIHIHYVCHQQLSLFMMLQLTITIIIGHQSYVSPKVANVTLN